jgi:hypothetical protein
VGVRPGQPGLTFTKWSQIRDEQIERIGREEFEAGKEQMLAEPRGWRLADIRRRRGLTQAQVAERMGAVVRTHLRPPVGLLTCADAWLDRCIAADGGGRAVTGRTGWIAAVKSHLIWGNRPCADPVP